MQRPKLRLAKYVPKVSIAKEQTEERWYARLDTTAQLVPSVSANSPAPLELTTATMAVPVLQIAQLAHRVISAPWHRHLPLLASPVSSAPIQVLSQ